MNAESICGQELNLLTALVAEFRAGSQFRLTICTSGWSLLRAALDAELRIRRVLMTTLRTRHRGLCGCLASALATLIRLPHRIAHRAGHRIAHCESSAETNTSSRATARILCRIAHRIRSLKLRIASNIADH